MPKNNSEWWRAKLDRNAERDREVTEALAAQGWKVVRVWEHSIRDDVAAVAEQVESVVRSHRTGSG